jgi:hypothetical protein
VRNNDIVLKTSYEILSANSPRIPNRAPMEHWMLYFNLIFQFRCEIYYRVYSHIRHRNWRFRSFICKQRAEQCAVNRIVGECRDEEWEGLQRRIQPGDRKRRRRLRRQMGIPPCDMTSRVLAWGMGSYSWRRPWASIPKQRLQIQASHLHRVVLIDEHRTSQVCIILLNTGICNCAGYDAPLPVLPVHAGTSTQPS